MTTQLSFRRGMDATPLPPRPVPEASPRVTSLGRRRVAYLTNVYPKISHSFIRTEIAALERAGFDVHRFTIRHAADLPRDGEDRMEATRTTALLDGRRMALAMGLVRQFARSPAALIRAIRQAVRDAKGRGGGMAAYVRSAAYLAEAATLAHELERRGLTHVHVHFGTNPVTVARLARQMSPITYSFTVHGPDEFDAPVPLDLKGKIADAAFVAGVSSFGRGQLMRWAAPGDWGRIAVVRCAVAPQFLTAPPPDATRTPPRRLVCVARLSAQKGLPLLIEAAARMKPQAPFTIDVIGDGEQRAEIEAQIERAGAGDRVRLLGWRHADAVKAELAGARAFVLPSFAEGLPVVLMEAMAVGRPVIATAIAGIPELVDRDTGWLIPSGSVQALADAMQDALDAPREQLARMGAAGQARVRAMHDPDANADVLAGLLAPLI